MRSYLLERGLRLIHLKTEVNIEVAPGNVSSNDSWVV